MAVQMVFCTAWFVSFSCNSTLVLLASLNVTPLFSTTAPLVVLEYIRSNDSFSASSDFWLNLFSLLKKPRLLPPDFIRLVCSTIPAQASAKIWPCSSSRPCPVTPSWVWRHSFKKSNS